MIAEKKMDMQTSEAIPFNVFYLKEFFNATLAKMEGKVADSHCQTLKSLSTYLLKENTIVEGLEKVAKYQTTNDLAIFLFDMLERANDSGPVNVVDLIPGLAEDFVNLYSLMVEDEESVKTLNQVVKDFKEKFGELEKEHELEEFMEIADKTVPKEAFLDENQISFFDFYSAELIKKTADILNKNKTPESAAFLFVAQTFIRFCGQDLAEKGNYSREVEKLNIELQNIVPGSTSFEELYNNLSQNAWMLFNLIIDFRDTYPDQYDDILQKGKIEQLQIPADEPEQKQREVAGIETLLVQYFKTEVEDYIEDLNSILTLPLDELNQSKNINALIKKFKGLKEVSMIHGYSGLEYISQLLTSEFNELKDSDKQITNESLAILDSVFNDIINVQNYHDKTNKDSVDKLKEKLETLKKTFVVPDAEEEIQENVLPEQISEVNEDITAEPEPEKVDEVAVEEETFSIDDSEQFNEVVRDFLGKVRVKISGLHENIEEADSGDQVLKFLAILKANRQVFHPLFNESFSIPLEDAYGKLFLNLADAENKLPAFDQIWSEISAGYGDTFDYEKIKADINAIFEDIDETFDIHSDQVQNVFIESLKLLWNHNRDNLFAALKGQQPADESINFLHAVKSNLSLLDYKDYIAFTDFVEEQINEAIEQPLNDEITGEFENAFKLFLERIEHQGKSGNCNDIIAAISDVLDDLAPEQIEQAESQTVTEGIPEETPEMEEESVKQEVQSETEEDEDISLFKEETKEYLDTISDCLDKFSNDQDRMYLVEVENACHSMRSAAHYLGLKDISKLSATLEEAAELFGQSDLAMPDDLDQTLKEALSVLKELIANPETDYSETAAKLEALLDNIVIEDNTAITGESEAFNLDKKKTAQLESEKKVEEKPLFAGDLDEDEELLQIFKEESATFLNNIKESNSALLADPDDDKAADAMGYASHSLKSAAKMLGFSEISQITDSLEMITDAINKKEIRHNSDLHAKVEEAVQILEKLSEGNVLGAAEISNIIYDLELPNWLETEEITEEDDELPENMLEIYVEEARELIEGLNKDFLDLEKMPESELVLAGILRRMHTLKGSSYISKFNHVGDLAHKMEDFMQIYKQKESVSKNEMLDTAFLAVDLMSEIVEYINDNGNERIPQLTTRLAEIDNKMFLFQNFTELPAEIKSTDDQKSISDSKARKKKSEDENIIKISTEYMDKLVDMASELMINQTQLGVYLHSLKEVLSDIEGEKKQMHGAENILEDAIEFGVLSSEEQPADSSKRAEEVRKISDNIKDVVRAVNMIHGDLNKLTEGLEQNISRISSISKLLHSDMLKTRMVPVENLFNRYPRAVRDMAQKQKKKVNLVIEDNNTEMDRAMVEGLAEPILHIIRNAIDHGLELPKERTENGKNETGTLLLKARQEKNQIVIDIEDDGRGIDLDIIRDKILEKNLAEADQVEKMSDAEVLDYIFYSEFSTRDEATDVSGRGIGLDAVSTQIQKLKGNIRVKTEKNVGTSFSLRVPLTLVISQALMVKINLQNIAIPVIAVQESIQFAKNDIVIDDNKKYIRVRGRLLPFVNLTDILKFSSEEQPDYEKTTQMAVVVYDAGISVALGIDELVGRQEVVIKSLGSHLQNVDYIAGGTILANGDVALILDYALVIRTIEMHFFGKVSERLSTRKTVRKAKPEKIEKKTQNKEAEIEEDIVDESDKTDDSTGRTREIKRKVIKDRKPKIIIVDDSNSVRNFVGSILERNGFTTIKSNNGADALEKMKIEKIDLMITDLEMPKMHGFDLISTIRDQKKYDNLPIIILTGRAGMKHRQTGEELGANAFIVKPFKEKDLLQSLTEFIVIDK